MSKACTGNQDEMSESLSASSAVPSVLQSHTCFLPRIQTMPSGIYCESSGELQPARLNSVDGKSKGVSKAEECLTSRHNGKKLQVTKCRIMYAKEMC